MAQHVFQLDSFGISDVGLIRELNEDSWAAYPDERLFLLADGMGGHASGEIAAKEAINSLYHLFKTWPPTENISVENAKDFFKGAFTKVNAIVHGEGEKNPQLKGMGTTLCSLFFLRNAAILTHVGDSRIYRLRGRSLEQLTEDHSLVSELLSLGVVRKEEAETFPYKHILTRAIGTHPRVESAIKSIEVDADDLFMLCSDGLTNYASDQQIETILNEELPLSQKGRALVDLAIEQGGGDNVTLILVLVA